MYAGIAGGTNINKLSQSLWHLRLRHLNVVDMKKVISESMLSGLDDIDMVQPRMMARSISLH